MDSSNPSLSPLAPYPPDHGDTNREGGTEVVGNITSERTASS
jgi:hypothetical protein